MKSGSIVRIAFILLPAMFSIACNVSGDFSASRAAVKLFHERLNSEQYHAIYAEADPMFWKATTEKDLTDLLGAVHRKLGMEKSESANGWNMNADMSGTFVTLTYNTTFAGGNGQETFRWRKNDGKWKLVNYEINSNALILK